MQCNAVGNVEGAFRRRTVLDLAQSVGLVQRNDGVGMGIAVAPQPFKELNPHLPKVGQFGGVALEHVAVVADPLALEQVDLAFLGVDAVFGED